VGAAMMTGNLEMVTHQIDQAYAFRDPKTHKVMVELFVKSLTGLSIDHWTIRSPWRTIRGTVRGFKKGFPSMYVYTLIYESDKIDAMRYVRP
jgi:hypothetical protein